MKAKKFERIVWNLEKVKFTKKIHLENFIFCRCEIDMASYQVEFAYTGTEDDELTLQIGDIISDCVQKEDGKKNLLGQQ